MSFINLLPWFLQGRFVFVERSDAEHHVAKICCILPVLLLAAVVAMPQPAFSAAGSPRPGIWLSAVELAALPVAGPAWENVRAAADQPLGVPDLADQDDPDNVRVLAKALVYGRLGLERYRTEVVAACLAAIGTEKRGRTLSLGRELAAYVIAADLVGLPAEHDKIFRAWLRTVLTEKLGSRTLQSTHAERPNNWGTHAGASRAAVAAYLGDAAELQRTARVFKGYLGDRRAHAGVIYGDLAWQAEAAAPVPINPPGARKNGHLIDGVLADDQRRAGPFSWPPPLENYVYEALQGALVQAVILGRVGYDVWNWQDQALLRAFKWLHETAQYPAVGDDTWLPHLINYYYGTAFPASVPTRPGKNMGWTDWTHGTGKKKK